MILRVLLLMALSVGSSVGISVTCPTKRYVVILFQPVTLTCNYQTSSSQPPVVTWRYKSFCQDPIQAALNPNSATNQLAQANPNYNPNIECSDSSRTVRIVASKQGPSVTLGEMYQARKVTIMNNADLSFGQTAWGDSGVYVCSVVSPQDLTGNNEDYTELIVLGRMSNTTDLLPGIDLLVMEVGHGSQVPLLRDQESGANSVRSGYRVQANPADNSTRVLYYMERELANFDPTRPGNANGKYERLAGMSEVSSLHEDSNPRGIPRDGMNRARNPPMAAIMDRDENMSTISSVSQQGRYRDDAGSRGGLPSRGRARSLDNLDDLGRSYYDEDHAERGGRERGRRGSDDEWSGRGYDRDDHRRRDYSPDSRRGDGGYNERRTRSRDDLANLDRGRSPAPRGRGYDDSILQEALQRKRMNEQKRAASRDRLDSGSEAPSSRSGRGERRGPDRRRHSDDEDRFPPPLPPPYSESESSKKSNLRKDGAVSRESLVV
nr:PREDICTED: lipolysis-stimulated lipoprotein receptor-like [Lepisosteus oculatus]